MSKLPIVSLSAANHRNENQILIRFRHDWALINVVKHIPHAKWSKTLKSWYVKNNPKNLKLIYSTFRGSAEVDNRLLFEKPVKKKEYFPVKRKRNINCLLYTSDAADE